MFREYLERIAKAESKQDAVDNIWNGENGISGAFNEGTITFNELRILEGLIRKMA